MQHFLRNCNNRNESAEIHDEMNGKYDALVTFLNPTMKTKIANAIKDTEPPGTLQQLSRVPYPTYKELTKLELTYKTYYEETQVIQKTRNRQCPTFHNAFNSLS